MNFIHLTGTSATSNALLLGLGGFILGLEPSLSHILVLSFFDPECDSTQDSLQTQIKISNELPGRVEAVGRSVGKAVLEPRLVGVEVAVRITRGG